MTTKTNAIAIRPLGDNLIVKRIDAPDKTPGGILLPENAKEKPKEGTVIAIGDGRVLDDGTRSPFSVTVWDTVLFSAYAGTEVKYGGDEYLVMREADILAIVD